MSKHNTTIKKHDIIDEIYNVLMSGSFDDFMKGDFEDHVTGEVEFEDSIDSVREKIAHQFRGVIAKLSA